VQERKTRKASKSELHSDKLPSKRVSSAPSVMYAESCSFTSLLNRKSLRRSNATSALMTVTMTDGRNARGNLSSEKSASAVYAFAGVSSFPDAAQMSVLLQWQPSLKQL
jgi:hypothetical protein